MDVYKTDKIRNVALLGHGGAGKTTLTESMAHLTGITSRMGNVTDGNTISDYDKEEIKRKFSISTAVVPVEWKKHKINILDTPGFFDFVGEVEEAVSAADAAVIVIAGKSGVQVGTEKAWNLCDDKNIPRLFFISGMDNADVNFGEIIEKLQDMYGKKVAPLNIPIREDGKLTGYVDVAKKTAAKYGAKGAVTACDVPGDLADELETYYDSLMESVAETSEEMMERYFGGEEFSAEEIAEALAVNIADCSIIPVVVGAPTQLQGVSNLLDDICSYFPDPSKRQISGVNAKTGDTFEANYDPAKEKSAYVWKTIADPFIGKYSLIKVCSGTLKADDTLYDADENSEMRLGKLYVMRGNKAQEVPELSAGDIGAIAKLDIATGDTLSTKAVPIRYEKTVLSVPYTYERCE